MLIACASLAGFLIAVLTVYLVLRYSRQLGLVDVPNERSSHDKPTPSGGGLGIITGLLLSFTLYLALKQPQIESSSLLCLIGCLVLIGLVGFLDDIHDLSKALRLLSHIIAAIIVIVVIGPLRSIDIPFLGDIKFGFMAVPVTLIWIIGVTNIYNFMDGIDGLAGGEGVLVGAFISCTGFMVGNNLMGALGSFIAASSLGFLVFNIPPAKIFMGDSGSTTLGFVFATIAIIGSQAKGNPVPFLVFVFLLSNFLFDATITLIMRIIRKENWRVAHSKHFYQKAVKSGYTHRQVTLFEYVLELLLGVASIIYISSKDLVQCTILILVLIVLTSAFILMSLPRQKIFIRGS